MGETCVLRLTVAHFLYFCSLYDYLFSKASYSAIVLKLGFVISPTTEKLFFIFLIY